MSMTPLTYADLEVLEFARARWKYAGAKVTAIGDRFGENETRYLQRLNALLERPEADAYDPETVRRLRDRRDVLRAHRTGVIR
jgi:hypothetical protein